MEAAQGFQEADVTVRERLRAALTAQVAAGTPHLVVGLSGLAFIDSSCLRVLCQVSRMTEEAGGSRAGHGVAVLLKIYAHCIDGQADAANKRITDALGTQDTRPESGDEGEDDSEQAY